MNIFFLYNGRFLALILLFVFLGGCGLPAYEKPLSHILRQESLDLGKTYPYRCTAGAHRGASVDYTENTMQALSAADADDRYAFIEFDVQYSEDRKIMVYHDKRLYRLYGNVWNISETTAEEIKEITSGNIPTFDQVMDVLTKKINIEIKSSGHDEEDRQLADDIVREIRKRHREKDVLITSLSKDVVRYVSQTYPDISCGLVFWVTSSTYIHMDGLTRSLYEKLEETGADYLILYLANLRNIDDLLMFKPKNKTIMFWDFDDTMFILHKDMPDRLWGTSVIRAFFSSLRYKIARMVHGID